MARSFFCPRCLDRVTAKDVTYRNRAGEVVARSSSPYDRGARHWLSAVWQGQPDPLYAVDLRSRAAHDADEVHPVCADGHRIPESAFELDSVVVGLVGEVSAGKTVYLGTLLDELSRGRLMPWLDLELDERGEELKEMTFGPFYANGSQPFQTAENQQNAGREGFMLLGRSATFDEFHLTVFDTSGGQSRVADAGRHNQYFYVSDVLVFVVTPEALGLPRRQAARRPDQRQTWSVTSSVVQAALRVKRERPGHAAVVVTKSDDIDPDRLDLLHDARGNLAYGEGLSLLRAIQVLQQDSSYVRSFLHSFENGRTLSERIENGGFSSVSYHLVSATGGPVDPATARFAHRNPQRVLDPLLLSLHQLGRFPADRVDRSGRAGR
jgi:hypothetical protein